MIEAASLAEKEAAREAAEREKAAKVAFLVAQIEERKKNRWETWWLEEDLYRLTDGKLGRLL